MSPAHTPHPVQLPDFEERLHRRDRKITGPRRAIVERLREARCPLSCKEILARLGTDDCDLATIYRSVRLLEEMGMVKKFDLGDGTARFRLLEDGDNGHHHHLICVRCTVVVEVDGCRVEELERELAQQNGFQAVTHRLEFFGLCPQCQSQPASAGTFPTQTR